MYYNAFMEVCKRKTEFFFHPPTKLLAKAGIHPFVLTFISFSFGLFAVYFLKNQALFFIFSGLSLLFDMFDGHLARYLHKTSKLGGYLDYTFDRIIEMSLLIFSTVRPLLILIAVFLFGVHQILFSFKKILLPARTLLMIFFVLQLFEIGMYSAIVTYFFGIILQLKKSF